MSEAQTPLAGSNPFSIKTVLALVVFGAVVFIALLWMIGAGLMAGSANDGGNHAEGRGLNGFAGMSRLLEKEGYDVRLSRSDIAFRKPGVLVLTPPHDVAAEDLETIVSGRRNVGPTLLIMPKWSVEPAKSASAAVKKGWVHLIGPRGVKWPGFLDDVYVEIGPVSSSRWLAAGLEGTLPVPRSVLSGSGERLVPLVVAEDEGKILAALLADGGSHSGFKDMALQPFDTIRGSERSPLIIVFEPDLINNYGLAKPQNARLLNALVSAAMDGEDMPVVFDLTLNGHARTANLLTLAFTPPFLAATLCLLLAAFVLGWRAFLRFGPPRKAGRAIAFGKTALVRNAAGFMRRTRRLHLISGPYVDRARERIVAALALPRQADLAATDAAIDRALLSRAPDLTPFSKVAASLRAASGRHDLMKAARDLHALERTLTR